MPLSSPSDSDEAQHFFADVACRLADALRHPSAGGPLYGIKVWEDGPAGLGEVPLTTLESLRSLYSGSASTLAELALTRARVTCGDPATMRMVEAEIRGVLARRRDPGPLAAEVVRIRAQIDERRGNDPFALRYSRGGLLDLELLAQYLVLQYSHRSTTPIAGATVTCFEALGVTRLVPVEEVRVLLSTTRMQRTIGAMLRLTSGGDITVQEAPEALKRRLVRALDCGSFEELATGLEDARRRVFGIFQNRMGSITQ